ncbi:MAG: 3-keto-disaccharide hydrolase [Planctomycetota bacterium]
MEDPDANPKSVWKVRDGEIWCTGNPTGFLRTKEEYSNYKLVLEWRWPEKSGNSGVLLHMGGEEKVWPLCMEAQLMHKRAGDLIGMGYTFNENKAKKGGFISYTPHMSDPSERELGEWNKYEITCKGGTIEATINGRLQNKATGVNISKGYIGLQSEGVPIVFRNIKLTPLN